MSSETTKDDLITIIDFCNEMATSIRNDWSDPRSECRAIWDAHDIAHAMTGGDATRAPWSYAHAWTADDPDDDDDGRWSGAAPDVFLRMNILVEKMRAASQGKKAATP